MLVDVRSSIFSAIHPLNDRAFLLFVEKSHDKRRALMPPLCSIQTGEEGFNRVNRYIRIHQVKWTA